MAKHLPAHLSHKSALVLLPHASITAPVEAVRRLHDKHFARWPPHINLLYPFLASPSETAEHGNESNPPQLKESIRVRLQKAVQSTRPFDVSLVADPPGMFSHSKRSKTVWLGPSTNKVQQLQQALQNEFSECDADKRSFTPHLSVGQANSDSDVDKLKIEIKSSIAEFVRTEEGAPVALDWTVDRVFVIERKGFHDRFKVVGSIDLIEV
ncbi:2'-5' RNA ligase superfamily-domain-containing protein [Phaeosphaeria sp. MPI-PUGE-AT-0046c]|nr:2'-5' RNA ligase superfamily-domain-containing protein [Phaeosphaeria sp. MPI-PUGE-AT-0046c]